MSKRKTYVKIRAWTSIDGWWIGTDERLRELRYFRSYGVRAKLFYLYCCLFYKKVALEIVNHDERGIAQ